MTQRTLVRIASMAAALAIAGLVASRVAAPDSARLVAVRDYLFTRYPAPDEWLPQYDQLGRLRDSPSFHRDHPDTARAAIPAELDRALSAGLRTAFTFEDSIRTMVGALPGFGNGSCGPPYPLTEKLSRMARGTGDGCCSDFTEVFLLLAEAHGMLAREVTNSAHTFNEVWSAARGRWMLVDPQFGLVATDSAGAWIGGNDVGSAARAGKPVQWGAIKSTVPARQSVAAASRLFTGESKWREFRIVAGADVVRQDRDFHAYSFLGKPIAQALEFVRGTRPGYVGTKHN